MESHMGCIMTDEAFIACMKQMQADDMEGLKTIYEAYLPMIYHAMYDVTGRKESAEDLTADYFIKLWNIRHAYKRGSHKKWMLVIARNMAIDYLRRSGREQLASDMQRYGQTGELSGQLDVLTAKMQAQSEKSDVYEGVVDRVAIADAMQRLTREEIELVHLKLMADLTFRELASLLRLPQGTVAWKYQQAIRKLREALKDA